MHGAGQVGKAVDEESAPVSTPKAWSFWLVLIMVTSGSPGVHFETPWSLWIMPEIAWALGARVEIVWARGPRTDAQLGMKPSKKRKKMKRAFILGVSAFGGAFNGTSSGTGGEGVFEGEFVVEKLSGEDVMYRERSGLEMAIWR